MGNWSTSAKSAAMVAKLAKIDAGINPATIEIGTSGMGNILLSFTLSKPSFVETGTGKLILLNVPMDANGLLDGIATEARIKDGIGVTVLGGLTVGTMSGDVIINNTAIATNQPASLQGMTIIHG